jgi:hypothetical protein
MSLFIADTSVDAPQFAASERLDTRPPAHVMVDMPPAPRQNFRFNQQIIPLDDGRTLLRLHEAPNLSVDPRTMEFEIEDWGIRMPCDKVEDLPHQIARKFITLFSKADQELIDSSEQLTWLKILDKVDYTQFIIERSSPHYTEGVLLKKTPLVVKWHDGTTEILPPSLASVFFPLDPDDNFSAYVKIGKGNHTLGIERISLIPA